MKFCRLILLSFCLTGCLVGPNFHSPKLPPVIKYTNEKLKVTDSAPTTAGGAETIVLSKKIPKQWWKIFHSKALNHVIHESILKNPDLKSAGSALKIAHENTLTQQTALLPVVGANYNPTKQLTAGTLASNLMSNAYLYTLNTSSLTITYMPDVLGLTRRQIESMRALEEVVYFQREAVYLTLTSNVVLTVISEAMLRAEIKATKKMIAIATDLYQRMLKERALGEIGKDSIAAQAALLAQVKTTLPPLEAQLAIKRHLLLVLQGHFPSQPMPYKFNLEMLKLPKELPLILPSELVRRRPDVRAAEASMHQASAKIGVAIANRLPNIMLSANGGYMPANFAPNSVPAVLPLLPLGSSLFWGIGASISQTVFDAGALLHQQRAAVEAYHLAESSYKSVVLNAFSEVSDTLKTITTDATALKLAYDYTKAAQKTYSIVKKKWQLGDTGYLEVLIAEQNYLQAKILLAQNQANRLNDAVALFQALGGGWC